MQFSWNSLLLSGSLFAIWIGSADRLFSEVFNQVPEAQEYQVLYELNLPGNAVFRNATPVNYATDNTGSAPAEFDRVAYYLELTDGNGTHWVYASMEAFTDQVVELGIPHNLDNPVVHQRNVENLNVFSNVTGVVTGSFLGTGHVEMWPSDNSREDTYGVFGANDDRFDWGDGSPATDAGYGSFQVHNPIAKQTVFAYNRWGRDGNYDDVGIGTQPLLEGMDPYEPDWTYARNANTFSSRKLVILVRPRAWELSFDALPQDRQLYPRDLETGTAVVPISGQEVFGGYDSIVLRVYRAGVLLEEREQVLAYQSGTADFGFQPEVTAELASYDFELLLKKNGESRLVQRVQDVVAGDAFLFYGQSNAEAGAREMGRSANEYATSWLRTYGQSGDSGAAAEHVRNWAQAEGDGFRNDPASIGQWAMVLGRKLVDAYGIPIAILNGSRGATNMPGLQKDREDPENLYDSPGVIRAYNRFRHRVKEAGVATAARAIFFYQGEADANDAAQHAAGYATLREDWLVDYPALEHFYVTQVRPGCGPVTRANVALREVQRRLGDLYPQTSVIASNGLEHYSDDCHFPFTGGYEELGNQHFRQVARDLYAGPDGPDMDALNPVYAEFSNGARNEVRLVLRNVGATVSFPEGALPDFYLVQSGTSITGRSISGNVLVFSLAESASAGAVLQYRSHKDNGLEWVTNANGMGMLSFELLVAERISVAQTGSDIRGENLQVAADGSEAAVIGVQLRDEAGNPLLRSAVSVTFFTNLGVFPNGESSVTLATDEQGAVTTSLTSLAPGIAEVTANIFGAGDIVRGSPVVAQFEGSGVFNQTAGTSHEMLQGAIDAATSGDVLLLAEGVYTGRLNIDKSLTLAGSFTLFNSLETIVLDGDVLFTGRAEIRASNVHVSPGVQLGVAADGHLVIDGTMLDSEGGFLVNVPEGAGLTVARSFVEGSVITGNSGMIEIYDNFFAGSSVALASASSGARVFHNVTDNSGWLTVDSGATVIEMVDGWANVTNPTETQNNLILDWNLSGGGGDPAILEMGRTKDEGGNVFVQPGDFVRGDMQARRLSATLGQVEGMFGYGAGFLEMKGLESTAPWTLSNSWAVTEPTGESGRVDAIFEIPTGQAVSEEIGSIRFQATAREGRTLFFFRVPGLGGSISPLPREARLLEFPGDPAFLTPFTINAGVITVDGTLPEIRFDPSSTVTQFAMDMTLEGAVVEQGTLEIELDSLDLLAGIEESGAIVFLEPQEGGPIVPAQLVSTVASSANSGFTGYRFGVEVDATSTNGAYNIEASVADRSGNLATATLGAVEINKNQISVTIELQGVSSGIERDVVFVFSGVEGEKLETRVVPLAFAGATQTILTRIPDGTTWVSAKSAKHLRKRLPVTLDSQGQGTVAFTGFDFLRGGDVAGKNVVGTHALGLLRAYFGQSASQNPEAGVADITGDGIVGTYDLGILRVNFGQVGDPE